MLASLTKSACKAGGEPAGRFAFLDTIQSVEGCALQGWSCSLQLEDAGWAHDKNGFVLW